MRWPVMAQEVIVETRRLTKTYRDFWGRQKKRALNALETLDFYGRLFNMPAAVRRERAQRLIDMVGLAKDKKRILKEYSKGMRQRIGLAQALINEPELVILDEPTPGLDPLGTRWMKDLIKNLRNQGTSILMCSHRL